MIKHIAMFRDEFLRRLAQNASVLELASGHGVLSLLAAEERPDIRIDGFDISTPAVAVAKRLLAVSGHGGRVSFAVKDALKTDGACTNGKYQGIISAMLAEHLSDPRPLFNVISHRTSRDGLVFFSTAIESPQRDHVFEYNQEASPPNGGGCWLARDTTRLRCWLNASRHTVSAACDRNDSTVALRAYAI